MPSSHTKPGVDPTSAQACPYGCVQLHLLEHRAFSLESGPTNWAGSRDAWELKAAVASFALNWVQGGPAVIGKGPIIRMLEAGLWHAWKHATRAVG